MKIQAFITVILLLFFKTDLHAQIQPFFDSTAAVIQIERAINLSQTNRDSAIFLLKQYAEKFSGQSPVIAAKALSNLGSILFQVREYQASIEASERSLRIYRQQTPRNWQKEADILRNLGSAYRKNNQHQESENALLEGESIFLGLDSTISLGLAAIYNNLGILYKSQGELPQAVEFYKKSIAIHRSRPTIDSVEIIYSLYNLYLTYEKQADSLLLARKILEEAQGFAQCRCADIPLVVRLAPLKGLGNLYNEQGLYLKGLQTHRQALNLLMQYNGPIEQIAEEHNNIALCYHNLEDYKNAVANYNIALKYFDDRRPKYIGEYLTTKNNKGTLVIEQEDWEEALKFYRGLAFEIDSAGVVFSENGANVYENLTKVYQKLGKFDEALKLIPKIVQIRDSIHGLNSIETAKTFQTVGDIYLAAEQTQEATERFQEGLDFLQHANPADNVRIGNFYASLGTVFKMQKNYEGAIDSYGSAIGEYQKKLSKKSMVLSRVYRDLSLCQALLKQTDEAIANAQLSLQYSGYQSDLQVHQNDLPAIIDALALMASIYEDRLALSSAWWYTQKVIQALGQQLVNFSEHRISESLYRTNNQIYNQSIDIAWKLYQSTDSLQYFENALMFINQAWAQELLYGYQKAAWESQLSTIEQDSLQEIVFSRYSLEKFLVIQEREQQNILDLAENSRLLKVQEEERLYRKFLAEKYPGEIGLTQSDDVSLRRRLQSRLSSEQSLIVFHQQDSTTLNALVLNRDQYLWKRLKLDYSLDKLVEDMRTGIQYYADPDLGRYESDQKKYTHAAVVLYQQLISPIDKALKEKVILTTNGILGKLPFEALLTTKPAEQSPWFKYPFMIRHKQIQYLQSLVLWNRDISTAPSPANGSNMLIFDAFTKRIQPEGDDNGSTQPKGFEEETSPNLSTIFPKAIKLVSSKATRREFLEKVRGYSLIHINAHAAADTLFGQLSSIRAFEQDSSIYAQDIYSRRLKARLVFLAGCETGLGSQRKGEGIIGLTHAFLYAGSENIIYALWEIPAGTTKTITHSFYTNLLQSQTISEALHSAKIKMIDAGGERAHPFFWSGLVVSGRAGKIF